MKRTTPQNSKYHKLISKLHQQPQIFIYDGRFELLGYQNPFKLRPQAFSLTDFRNLMKQLDFEYEKDEDGLAVSSTKLSIEQLGSHINFLDVLCAELGE